jgi:hypothetical protein
MVKSKKGEYLGFANNLNYAYEIANRYFKINPKLKYVIIEEKR